MTKLSEKFRDLENNWKVDLVLSVLGMVLINISLNTKETNPSRIVAFLLGILFNIPTFYFKIFPYLKELFLKIGEFFSKLNDFSLNFRF